MCILMYYSPGAMPIREHLQNGCDNNPDGFGWAIVTFSNEILMGHSMDAETAIAEFLAVRAKHPENTAIFHARIATAGSVDKYNCHPFRVNGRKDMVLAHNGILPYCQPEKGDRRSDTRILAEDVMMQRFGDLDDDKVNRAVFEEWVGNSKVIVLTTDREFAFQSYIFNQQMGIWLFDDDGKDIWYSNSSYCKRQAYVWKYPTEIGYARDYTAPIAKKYTEGWNADSQKSFNNWAGYVQACGECGYDLDDCACQEPLIRYMPEWQVKSLPTEPDWSDSRTWLCEGCHSTGGIDPDTGRCEKCFTMFCCDMKEDACQCGWRKLADMSERVEMLALEGPKGQTVTEFLDGIVTDLS